MVKNISMFLSLVTFLQVLSADEQVAPVVESREYPLPVTIEARLSYFWPESSLFQDVYHNGGINYQLTGTVPVYKGHTFALRGLNFWWAVDYFYRTGETSGLNDKTRIQIEPLTAGLKYIYPVKNIRPYFGAAFKYYFVQVHNSSPYVKKYIADNGLGGSFEIGFLALVAKYMTMDLFISYSFKQFGVPTINLPNVQGSWFDVGGLNIGGGIGVKF